MHSTLRYTYGAVSLFRRALSLFRILILKLDKQTTKKTFPLFKSRIYISLCWNITTLLPLLLRRTLHYSDMSSHTWASLCTKLVLMLNSTWDRVYMSKWVALQREFVVFQCMCCCCFIIWSLLYALYASNILNYVCVWWNCGCDKWSYCLT